MKGSVAALIMFLLFFIFILASGVFWRLEKVRSEKKRIAITKERMDRVVRALTGYASVPDSNGYPLGRFPGSLNELVEKRLVSPEDLLDEWRKPLIYAVQNNPSATDCLPDMVSSGNIPVAVVVSGGPNRRVETDLTGNLLEVQPSGDDIMATVTLSRVAEEIMLIVDRRLELWAQAASNDWQKRYAENCSGSNPDRDHCCDPEKDASCEGPSVFFPQNRAELATVTYGDPADVVKMVDVKGNPVVYSVTGPYTITFTLTCPGITREFEIPEVAR